MTESLHFPSPIGPITLYATHDAIVASELDGGDWHPADLLEPSALSGTAPSPLLRTAARQVLAYLDGDRVSFDLHVRVVGTAFQHAVWRELAAIPFGETMTYGEIAEAIGAPHAGRAVGAAVAANPVPILVPCHRVLGARRQPVGYDRGRGLDTKMWLLRHESIPFEVTKRRSRSLVPVP